MNTSSYKQLFLSLAIVLLAPIAQAADSEEDKTFYFLGTEDIYKIYAESFKGQEHLQQIQGEARDIVAAALSA